MKIQLIQFTKYKAEYACKVVELVDPKNTTQYCSNEIPKSLSVRTHKCPYCGLEMDRDVNAAINILNLGTVGTTDRNCGFTNVGLENEAENSFLAA